MNKLSIALTSLGAADDAIHRLEKDNERLSREVSAGRQEIKNLRPDWFYAPEWAVGAIEYRNGGKYWISNDGLRLKERQVTEHA